MRGLSKWGARAGRGLVVCTLILGVWLMASASLSYAELGEGHPFFLEKLPLERPDWWLLALYVHVPSALLALPACLVLMLHRLRARLPRLHRWLGRFTGTLVLFAVVPSGMYLALFARGGWISTLGFWLTGGIAFVAMLLSIARARAGDVRGHRRFSTHVMAQLAVAVASRFMLVGAESMGLYDDAVYVSALWIPVIGCALIAELSTRPRRRPTRKGPRHETLVAHPRFHPVR